MDALERFGDSVKINSKFGHTFASRPPVPWVELESRAPRRCDRLIDINRRYQITKVTQ
jgi:hypothetical protein